MNETIDGFSRALRLRNIKSPSLKKMYQRERYVKEPIIIRTFLCMPHDKREDLNILLYNTLYIIFYIII